MAGGKGRCTTRHSSAPSTRCRARWSAGSDGICSPSARSEIPSSPPGTRRTQRKKVESSLMRFTKAHAYGNDFLYVLTRDVERAALDRLARELCDRHTGVGADGLIVYEPTPDGAAMRLFNADGSRSEVSGNGVRGLGALLLREDHRSADVELTIQTEAGPKRLTRTGRTGSRQTFRAAMGVPRDLRQVPIAVT